MIEKFNKLNEKDKKAIKTIDKTYTNPKQLFIQNLIKDDEKDFKTLNKLVVLEKIKNSFMKHIVTTATNLSEHIM